MVNYSTVCAYSDTIVCFDGDAVGEVWGRTLKWKHSVVADARKVDDLQALEALVARGFDRFDDCSRSRPGFATFFGFVARIDVGLVKGRPGIILGASPFRVCGRAMQDVHFVDYPTWVAMRLRNGK